MQATEDKQHVCQSAQTIGAGNAIICLMFQYIEHRSDMYCTVLYCAVLCCTVLYCTVLYCAVLCCAVVYVYLYVYCTVHCIALHKVGLDWPCMYSTVVVRIKFL